MTQNSVHQVKPRLRGMCLSKSSDDEVFDDSGSSSPMSADMASFSFDPSQIAQYSASTGIQAQIPSQRHLQQQLQQQQQQQQQRQIQQQQQQIQQQLLQQHYSTYQAFATPTVPPYVPSMPYPVIDPLDAWLAMSPYAAQPPIQSPMYEAPSLSPWNPNMVPFAHTASCRPHQRRKRASSSSPTEKKPAEVVDVIRLSPRDALMKAKVRLANLSEWKSYTKNNTWTPEVILDEDFVVPINIKFLQLVPTGHYSVSIGFALREDTPGLMSFSDETMQWNSIEGAVHQAPRRLSNISNASSSPPAKKSDPILMASPPKSTIKLSQVKYMTGTELMESPKEFTHLHITQTAEENNQIALRPYFKYSPCLYLSLLDHEDDDVIFFTRKVMIHDIKMIPVEYFHNPMLATFPASSSDSSS